MNNQMIASFNATEIRFSKVNIRDERQFLEGVKNINGELPGGAAITISSLRRITGRLNGLLNHFGLVVNGNNAIKRRRLADHLGVREMHDVQ